MRDTEKMVHLLRVMASAIDGRIYAPGSYDDVEEREKHHQVELLVDVGQAEWIFDNKKTARITKNGYDFLNAIDNGEGLKMKFDELIQHGKNYGTAATFVLKLASLL